MTEAKVKRIMLIATITSVTMLTLLAIGGLFVITRGPHAGTLPMLRTEVASAGTVTPTPQETAPVFLTDDMSGQTDQVSADAADGTLDDTEAEAVTPDQTSAPQPEATPTPARKVPATSAGATSSKTSRTTATTAPERDSDHEHDDGHEDDDDDHEREVIGPDVRETHVHGD